MASEGGAAGAVRGAAGVGRARWVRAARPRRGAGSPRGRAAEESVLQDAYGVGELDHARVVRIRRLEAVDPDLTEEEIAEDPHRVRDVERGVRVGVSPPEERPGVALRDGHGVDGLPRGVDRGELDLRAVHVDDDVVV